MVGLRVLFDVCLVVVDWGGWVGTLGGWDEVEAARRPSIGSSSSSSPKSCQSCLTFLRADGLLSILACSRLLRRLSLMAVGWGGSSSSSVHPASLKLGTGLLPRGRRVWDPLLRVGEVEDTWNRKSSSHCSWAEQMDETSERRGQLVLPSSLHPLPRETQELISTHVFHPGCGQLNTRLLIHLS